MDDPTNRCRPQRTVISGGDSPDIVCRAAHRAPGIDRNLGKLRHGRKRLATKWTHHQEGDPDCKQQKHRSPKRDCNSGKSAALTRYVAGGATFEFSTKAIEEVAHCCTPICAATFVNAR
jgi:hypothetical protein